MAGMMTPRSHSAAGEFPVTLGPFGVTPTGLIPIVQHETATYALPVVPGEARIDDEPVGIGLGRRRALRPGDGRFPDEVGQISPIVPLTLTDAERRLANIKPSAASFCWAYPLGQGYGIHRMSDEEKAKVDAAFDKASLFITFGGFLYFDVNGGCIQVSVPVVDK